MKTKLFLLFFGLLGFVVQSAAKEKIYVNSEVTTHIVMPENIKLVDISTTKIMGNQCADNMVRIKPYLEKDILFHAEIARATGNQVTTNLMPVIQSGISLFIDVTDYSIANKTIVTHREVLEAIKRHDPEGASEAMKRHLENNRVQIKLLMKKME